MSDEVTTVGLLGPVVVHRAGRSVDLGGAQRRAVLARLALAPGRVVGMDALIDGLWVEPPATARKVVQVHVSRLRAVLPAGAVATSGGGYLLEVDPVRVDAHRFEDALVAARAAPGPDQVLALLEEAEGLWRGPPLGDVGDVPYAGPHVARLHEAHLESLELRSAAALELGRSAAVVAELEPVVHEHPLRERLWALLVAALHRSGRQAEALRAYERGRAALAEVGLEPGADLREAGEAALRDPPAAPRPRPASETGPALVAPPVLVGRDAERAALVAAVDDTANGAGPGLLALRGEEGMGKSTLLAALAADVAGRARVAVGRCREHAALPFAPWADILDELGATDLSGLVTAEADVETAEARRVELFTATVRHLRTASGAAPVVVILDDLHWADDATVSLLLHVLDETEGDRVAVVTAWRPGDVAVGHPSIRVVDRATRLGAPAVDLAPLTTSDIEAMLAAHAPDDDAARRPDAASLLLEVTSGVPLFVADAVGATRQAGTGLTVDLDRPRVPDTTRSIVDRRLTEAGTRTVPVAEAAAVLGEGASFDRLADLVGGELVDVLEAVDDLCRVGLLHDGDPGPRYTHSAFRAAVIESMRRGRLQGLHARAFRLLPAQPSAAPLRAHHVTGADRLVSDAEADQALVAAAAEAAGRGAFADAAAWYRLAVERAPDDERAARRVQLADCRWRAGDIATAKATAADIVDGAVTGRGDPAPPEVLVDAAVLHSTVGAGFGPDDESIAILDTVLGRVADPLLRSRVAVARAYHHAAWGSPASVARAAIDTARERLPTDAPADLDAHLRFAEGLALLDCPDLSVRLAQAESLLEIGRRRGSARDRGRALRLRGMAELSARDLDALEATTGELEQTARDTGSWMYASDVWRWRAAAALARDDLPGAQRAVVELEHLAGGPLAGRVFVGTQHLLLARAKGDLERSLAMVEAMRAVMPAETAWQTERRLADLYRLDLLAAMDRQDEATEDLVAMAPWAELHLSSCRRYPAELAMIGAAVGRAGLTEPAADLARRLTPFAGQHVVLGWGEALIGSFDDALAALAPLLGSASA